MAAIIACAAAVIGVTAATVPRNETDARTTTVTSTTTAELPTPTPEPLSPNIDGVLLDPGGVQAVIGGGPFEVLNDNNHFDPPLGADLTVSPPECLSWATLADAPPYAGADWLAVRRSVIAPVNNPPRAPQVAMQSVVTMRTPAVATTFIADTLATWRQCQGKDYFYGSAKAAKFAARDAVDVAGMIVATAVQTDVPTYRCVHVLSAVDQFVVGARTCGLPDDKAPALVAKLRERVPR